MKNQNMHSILLTLVGGYILYTAWHLLDNLLSGVEDIPRAAAISAIVVFAVAGIGVLLYAGHLWRRAKKAEDSHDEWN